VISVPRRVVLLGHPVAHSLSPVFQNAAIAAAGLSTRYETWDVAPEALADAVATLREEGAAGNVTVPHKGRVAELCDLVTAVAARAAAVNTFWVRDGLLHGDNTDVAGFTHAVRGLLGRAPSDLTVGVLGAGGAAAAVLAAIESWPGCQALVWNRTRDRADVLSARFRSVAQSSGTADIADRADLVVNATTVGLHDDGSQPMDPAHLRASCAVIDLVYRRGDTPFVRAARARGLSAVGGLPMLLEQGALAFERWFGVEPDRALMAEAVAAA
jgi:shikimate dehydrogenase